MLDNLIGRLLQALVLHAQLVQHVRHGFLKLIVPVRIRRGAGHHQNLAVYFVQLIDDVVDFPDDVRQFPQSDFKGQAVFLVLFKIKRIILAALSERIHVPLRAVGDGVIVQLLIRHFSVYVDFSGGNRAVFDVLDAAEADLI